MTRKNRCVYYKCKGIAIKQIKTKLNREPYILNICEECYKGYLEDMAMIEGI